MRSRSEIASSRSRNPRDDDGETVIASEPKQSRAVEPGAPPASWPRLRLMLLGLGSAVGPLIGGVLVAHWGWPGVFWFRAPIALTALLFLRGLPQRASAGHEQRFDIIGAVLLALGLASLLMAFNALPRLGEG